jgi:hypothetical protein
MTIQELQAGTRVKFTDADGEHTGVVKSTDANGNAAVWKLEPPIEHASIVTKKPEELSAPE